ncbi:MAG: hypothetical protein ACOX8Q_04770 [Christensenellales bacterium]
MWVQVPPSAPSDIMGRHNIMHLGYDIRKEHLGYGIRKEHLGYGIRKEHLGYDIRKEHLCMTSMGKV